MRDTHQTASENLVVNEIYMLRGANRRDPSPNLWSRKGFPEKSTPDLSLKMNPSDLCEEGWPATPAGRANRGREAGSTRGAAPSKKASVDSGRAGRGEEAGPAEQRGPAEPCRRPALGSPPDRGTRKGPARLGLVLTDRAGLGVKTQAWGWGDRQRARRGAEIQARRGRRNSERESQIFT